MINSRIVKHNHAKPSDDRSYPSYGSTSVQHRNDFGFEQGIPASIDYTDVSISSAISPQLSAAALGQEVKDGDKGDVAVYKGETRCVGHDHPPGANVIARYKGWSLAPHGVTLVEMVIGMYFLTTMTAAPTIQLYQIQATFIQNYKNNWTESQVLDKVSDYTMYLSFCSNFPAVLSTYLIARLADKFGRKVAILSGLMGGCLKLGIYIAVIHLGLRVEYFYIGNFLEGLCGNYGTFLMGVYGMLADITQPGYHRNKRFAMAEAATFIMGSVGVTSAGYWVQYLGFEPPMLFAISVQGAAIVFTLLFLPESLCPHTGRHVSGRSLKDAFLLFCSKYPAGRRSILLLVLLVFAISITCLQVNTVTTLLYLQGGSFRWPSTKITLFSGCYTLASWFSVVLITSLLGKRYKENSFVLIGCVCSTGGALIQGLAINDAMLYIAAVVGLLSNFMTPMTRAILSKTVSAGEQGSLFSGVGVVEMLFSTLGAVGGPALFKVGLTLYYGFHCLAIAALASLTIIAALVLKVLMRRREGLQYAEDG